MGQRVIICANGKLINYIFQKQKSRVFPRNVYFFRFQEDAFTDKNADEETIKNWINDSDRNNRIMIADRKSITGFEADTIIGFGENDCALRAKSCYMHVNSDKALFKRVTQGDKLSCVVANKTLEHTS